MKAVPFSSLMMTQDHLNPLYAFACTRMGQRDQRNLKRILKANYSLLNNEERRLASTLVALGNANLFNNWPPPGTGQTRSRHVPVRLVTCATSTKCIGLHLIYTGVNFQLSCTHAQGFCEDRCLWWMVALAPLVGCNLHSAGYRAICRDKRCAEESSRA